ncbi:MAG TPA: cell surface protein SprA [Gemmatimonadaceae bacterium]|nr:cell surface protein SprA [Gemmatimonadaceae bacterium]
MRLSPLFFGVSARVFIGAFAALTTTGALGGAAMARGQVAPPRDTARTRQDSTRKVVMPRPPADSDSTRRPGTFVVPGLDIPVDFNLRIEGKTERDRNLRCNSLEAVQISALSGCNAGFLPWNLDFKGTLKTAGIVGDRVHVNVDYDMQREFDASNTVSLFYEGDSSARFRRVDVGNIAFVAPASRFMTSSLPSGNYGIQLTNQFGALKLRSIFARQTGNVIQNREYRLGGRVAQTNEQEIADYQIERLRFFFTVDPALFGTAYPNIDILNKLQMQRLNRALPDTLRPSRVLLYRLQFGTQPQNPNGPRFRVRGGASTGTQTYDLLREGVDYYMDQSLLWFALVRPLNETNERLVVAYNVRINGRDTVWTTTGGTPDVQYTAGREQVANLVMDPSVGPSSPQFRNEIRSVYRVAGSNLVRRSVQLRVVTGSGLLEHPIAGSDATFLQMFGLAQPTNPAEFDFENRLWPRVSDPVFDLGAGAADVRGGQSLDLANVIKDYFLVFPSVRPFSERGAGLVVPGNPTNDQIYTTPGEYIYSAQHPTSRYRLRVRYETGVGEEAGALNLGSSQMRPGSERIVVDGRPLVRELDYRIDYDVGRLEFLRPDTLFRSERRVLVSYEENASYGASQTTLAGLVSDLPLPHGTLTFAAINQSQSTPFNRPQLGLQSNSTLTTGATAQFSWELPSLTRFAGRLPFGDTDTPSRLSLFGEIASSHPQFAARNQGQAYVETFDAGSGTTIALGDQAWYWSSLPAYGSALRAKFGGAFFEQRNASTLVWQTNVQTPGGTRLTVTRSGIDPLLRLTGSGIESNEPVLWLTLLPLDQAGRYDRTSRQYQWTAGASAAGGSRRFRSIRTVLRSSGLDLTRGEHLEFWTLLDTSAAVRAKNPTLVFDFGDVSENSLTFAPETLTIKRTGTRVDSLFGGRKLQGFDRLDSERDPFSRAFNADVNDTGLPGDVVDTLVVVDGSTIRKETNVRTCRGAPGALDIIGDPRTNCTIANAKLDEEDIDLDNAPNLANADRERERLLRYVVDLSDPSKYKRVGNSFTDTLYVQGAPRPRTRQWVLVSVPFGLPSDSLNDVDRRKLRALRLTVVSGAAQEPEEPTQLPIAELHVTGSPWLDRSPQTLAGIGGVRPDGGFVVTSTVGTNDSSSVLSYQPPPGVVDEANFKGAQFQAGLTAINESSLRIQAGNMPVYHRAEAYWRFPTGAEDYLLFEQLRLWGRGRGNGWGQSGDLQMYVKIGRDENNFYLYRSPVNAGQTQAAWTDLAIDLSRFVRLRDQIQQAYLAGKKELLACAGVDSAIVTSSPTPIGAVVHRFAACDNGYMVYTVDPAVTAPNLASVQEVAVGMVRVGANAGAFTAAGDTLELWVDDIRLDRQKNSTGWAGQVTGQLNLADFAEVRVNVSNRDPNFRQLGEQASFLGQRTTEIGATVRLDRMLPRAFGLALPLTVSKISLASDPLFLSQTDISGSSISALRKPKNDITTYSLTIRRTTPFSNALAGPLLNNLSATTTYVSGVDRTEFQDGKAHNFSFSLDYLVTDDTAHTLGLESWKLRWNPTQFRLTSGIVQGSDRRASFIQPSGAVADEPSLTTASTRLWRNSSVVELRPTTGSSVRWEVQSLRDFRNYDDSASGQAFVPGEQLPGRGFERERTMIASVGIAPIFSSWFRPRADVGTQYNMLRDPNARAFLALPGVIGIDSVLAARDSATLLQQTLPRRMTAAQTASAGSTIDVAALSHYASDSSLLRRVAAHVAPIDVSFTRSLLSALDAAPADAPLPFQLGIGGPSSFRSVGGMTATTAGQTDMVSAASTITLPFGGALENRYRHTSTNNWIARLDSTQARADGEQTYFPDARLRWSYRPAGGMFSSIEASTGYTHSDATASLPSLSDALGPPQIRKSHSETFPVGGSIAWAGRAGLSMGSRFAHTNRVDSLPGSVARSGIDEIGFDFGRSFHVPESLGLGLRSDVRTRAGLVRNRLTTYVTDPLTGLRSRLADNGKTQFNLTADSNVSDNLVLTLQGSHIVTFDNNLNRRFQQTLFSTILQFQFYGVGK